MLLLWVSNGLRSKAAAALPVVCKYCEVDYKYFEVESLSVLILVFGETIDYETFFLLSIVVLEVWSLELSFSLSITLTVATRLESSRFLPARLMLILRLSYWYSFYSTPGLASVIVNAILFRRFLGYCWSSTMSLTVFNLSRFIG